MHVTSYSPTLCARHPRDAFRCRKPVSKWRNCCRRWQLVMMSKPFYRCLKTQRFAKAGREWRLGTIAGAPTHWWGSTSLLLRPAILGVRQIYRAQEGNPGPPGAFSGLCSPVLSTTGSTNPTSQPEPKPPSLFHLAQYWLLDGEPTAAQIAERVVVNRLLRALPRTHSQAVGMWNPATIDELVEAMELADAAQHRDAGEQAPPFPRRVVQERRASEGTLQPVSRPAAPTPRDKPMPTEVKPNPQTDCCNE